MSEPFGFALIVRDSQVAHKQWSHLNTHNWHGTTADNGASGYTVLHQRQNVIGLVEVTQPWHNFDTLYGVHSTFGIEVESGCRTYGIR